MTERPPSDTDVSRLLRLAGRRPAVPAEAAARVHETVRARWQAAITHRRRRRHVARAAAAAAAVVAVFLLAPRPAPPPAVPGLGATVERVIGGGLRRDGAGVAMLQPGGRVPAGTWLETPPDGRAALRVARGASLRLDFDTRLRVLTVSEVWLERGGAYVDSEGRAGATALRIHTREGQVTDVGTQFQVRAPAGGVQVHVREGQVFVVGRSGRHEASAGTRLDVAGGQVRRTAAPGHGAAWAWVEEAAPEYDIEGRSLDAFLGWASRETGLRVRFESERLERAARGTLLHGSSRGLTASQAIEAVLPASGLVGRRSGGTLWIARASAEAR